VKLIRVAMAHILYILCLETARGNVRLMITRIKFKVKKLTIKLKLKLKISKVRSLAINNLKVNKK
jgi:hypothetical protein